MSVLGWVDECWRRRLTWGDKSLGEGITGRKANRCIGLVTDLVFPSMSTTRMLGEVKALGKAVDPRGGWLAQSK
jgi:hypothetical protein